MENNKYYTPSIEEFHVGFEYESATLRRSFPWSKKIASHTDIDEVEACLRLYPEGIRVKYLDKEDIESLGFKIGRLHPDRIFHPSDWTHFHNNKVEISFYDNPKERIVIDNGLSYDENETYFQGRIKNKTELKKILKMIGV